MIRCEADGAPRDLGWAQGTALRAARRAARGDRGGTRLRDAVDFVLRFGGRHLRSPLHTRARLDLARETRRHFPHFAERHEALLRAAGVSTREGWEVLAERIPGARSVVREANALRVALSSPRQLPGFAFRDLRADGSLRVQSLAPAALASAIAGQNEAGLAGAAALRAPQRLVVDVDAPFAAPAFLLLEQCLERCESAEGAARLASRRPGTGHVTLHFLDAKHDYWRVEVDDSVRKCVREEKVGDCQDDASALRLIPGEKRMVAPALDLNASCVG